MSHQEETINTLNKDKNMSSAKEIAELRGKTGAGMLDCKKALDECSGDMEKAIDWLRKTGAAKAAKRADKIAAEGMVTSYIHAGGRIGVLVEVNCETDFVAKNDDFKMLVSDIAMHIAASAPKFVSREEVTTELMDREREVYRDQLKNEGKPEEMKAKILEGKLNSYFSEKILLEQKFIKNQDTTIASMLDGAVQKFGEKTEITRFVRFAI